MRDKQHYHKILQENPDATVWFTMAASIAFAEKHGACEQHHRGTPQWKQIARKIKSIYGTTLTIDDVYEVLNSLSQYT